MITASHARTVAIGCPFNGFFGGAILLLGACTDSDVGSDPFTDLSRVHADVHAGAQVSDDIRLLDADAPALHVMNADAVLDSVIDVVTGSVYDDRLFTSRRFADLVAPDSTTYVLEREADHYALQEYTCPEGGSAIGNARVEEDGLFDNSQLTFTACTWENTRHDGSVIDFDTTDGDTRYRFDALTLSDSDGQSHTLNGEMSRTVVEDWGSGDGMRLFSVAATDYTVSDPTDTFMLEDVETSLSRGRICPRDHDCYPRAQFRAMFTLRATTIAGGHALTVETTEGFDNAASDVLRFDRGTLSVTADDGSRMTIEADNGDPASFAVTVVENGVENTWNRAWDELRERLEFVR